MARALLQKWIQVDLLFTDAVIPASSLRTSRRDRPDFEDSPYFRHTKNVIKQWSPRSRLELLELRLAGFDLGRRQRPILGVYRRLQCALWQTAGKQGGSSSAAARQRRSRGRVRLEGTLSQALTLQYDKVMFILWSRASKRRRRSASELLYRLPRCRISIRYKSVELAYRTFNRIHHQGAIADNKQLGAVFADHTR
jgi:hypothetical protein